MAGKGSRRRPKIVTYQEWDDNWALAFRSSSKHETAHDQEAVKREQSSEESKSSGDRTCSISE